MTTFSEQHKNNPAISGEIKGLVDPQEDRIKELEGLLDECIITFNHLIKYTDESFVVNCSDDLIKKITETLAKEDRI